jgi:hypothetical protein
MASYLPKETLKAIITRKDNNQSYSVAIKDAKVVYTPGSPNEESVRFSKDGGIFNQNNIMSYETTSVSFDVVETDDPTELSHIEWDLLLKNVTLRFDVQFTESVTAKVKAYDMESATITIGANDTSSFNMVVKGNVVNVVK